MEITPKPQASGMVGETAPQLAALGELERVRGGWRGLGTEDACLFKSCSGLTSVGKAASSGS